MNTEESHVMKESSEPLPVPPPTPRHYDPSMEFPKDMEQAIRDKVDAEWQARPAELNLERDSLIPSHQNFALVSFCGPTCPQKHDSFCLKIKGVFETMDKAKEWADKVHKIDNTFVMTIIPVGEWGLFPPDLEKCGDQVYVDEELNKIINEHQKSQEAASQIHAERKQLLKSQPDINKALAAEKLADEESKLRNLDQTIKDLEKELDTRKKQKEEQVTSITEKAAELELEPDIPKEATEEEGVEEAKEEATEEATEEAKE